MTTPLSPPDYRKTEFTHRRGERADQPLPNTVLKGTLYYVIDEGIVEQSNGLSWETYAGAGARTSNLVNFSYSANTASPPGTNQVRFNAAFPYTSVTKLYFDHVTADGQDILVGFLRVVAGSIIYVQDKNDHTQYAYFQTTSAPVDHTTWIEFNVTHYSHGNAIGGGQLVLVQNTGGPTDVPALHHATHETGGTDEITGAISPLSVTTGVITTSGTMALNSGQIAFPATQVPSGGANTLDDYEEGTWTPFIGGSGGESGQVYSVQAGYYIKIGKLVFVSGRITLSTLGTVTGQVRIEGLPFTVENIAGGAAGAQDIIFGAMTTNWVTINVNPVVNTTTANLIGATAAATSNGTALAQADMSNTTDFRFNFSYRASA